MLLPEEYRTGNKKMDEKIAKALLKNPTKQTVLQKKIAAQIPQVKENKYNVSGKEDRTYKDGTVFASYGELVRWDYLLKVQEAGEIKDLQMQVPFILQEEFISRQWGNIQPITYVADFVYLNISFRKGFENRICVEDVKGDKLALTQTYKLKKRMFLYKYGLLAFFEVYPD